MGKGGTLSQVSGVRSMNDFIVKIQRDWPVNTGGHKKQFPRLNPQ